MNAEYNAVSHPSHYCEGRKYEPKDVIRDWGLNFNIGSAVKYLSRAGRKGDIIEDLEKAKQFIQFEIDYILQNKKQEKESNNKDKYSDVMELRLAEPKVDYPAKKRFFYKICDKYGNMEMAIWHEPDLKPCKFFVYYPRFENSGAILITEKLFQEFTLKHIKMLVFAYSEEEYWKFEKAFWEWSSKNDKSDN